MLLTLVPGLPSLPLNLVSNVTMTKYSELNEYEKNFQMIDSSVWTYIALIPLRAVSSSVDCSVNLLRK